MASRILFAAALAILSWGESIHADGLEKRSFSIPHSTPPQRHLDGPAALRKAYLKHGFEVPEALRLRKRQSIVAQLTGPNDVDPAVPATTASEVAITEKNDLEYLSPVEIGSTTMQLDFDTGSSDLWVFSERIPQQQRVGHQFYSLANNTDAKPLEGLSWKIAYGDGSGASGVVFADRVKVGGVTATRQAVEAATSISSQFIEEHSDGLLGLGFGNTNTIKPTKQPTFFENIKPSLKEPLFTVTLKKNSTGVYDFGFIDPQKYIEPLQYVPINTTRGYWEYTTTGYSVGDGPMTKTSFQSIADTGTTLLLLPPDITRAYYANVKGANLNVTEGGYVFPCNSLLPDLTVELTGGVKATVPGTFMNRSLSMTKGSTSCYGGIQQGSNTLSIWGDVFLKSQFAVFDGRSPPRIGFAKQNERFSVPTSDIPPRAELPPSSPKAAPEPLLPTASIPGVVVPGPVMTLAPIAPVKPVEERKGKVSWAMSLFDDLASRWGGGTGDMKDGVIGRNRRMVGRFKFEDAV
ncbi:hypothetical protein FKW77_005524 [Venturia effusa]|uniref:Peptidase A1 domain-containing protein n=1 Tax=Venturia effusa TaxID=50376 RepID=A0A517LH94_9PEZI|nr:hypothetical protein FKW77_005524 [Venturia effusa]